MRIKLLKNALVTAISTENPVTRNTVIESDDEADVGEFKALVAAGYAKETKDAVTGAADEKKKAGISGIDTSDDAHWKALEGNVEAVTEYLGTLDAAGVKRVAKLEASAKGKQRVGVADAAESALSALSEG